MRKPDKYSWKPQELLKQLAHIYLNLGRADPAGEFVAAIAADKRSYHEGLFVEAAEVKLNFVDKSYSGTSECRNLRCRLYVPAHFPPITNDCAGSRADHR